MQDTEELASLSQRPVEHRSIEIGILHDPEAVAIPVGVGLGLARAVSRFAIGHAVDDRQPNADAKPRHSRADAVGDRGEESGAVLEAATVPAVAGARAQQLVPEVAVAVLDVDELKADVVGAPGGIDEVVDQAIDLVVCHQRDAAGKALVEDWIDVRRERLGPVPHVRAREAARVRKLQAEIEVAVGVGAEAGAMRGHELVAE